MRFHTFQIVLDVPMEDAQKKLDKALKRNLVGHLRNYITIFPEDKRGIFSTLWLDGEEVLAIRLRELLLRMDEVNTECFGLIVSTIYHKEPSSLLPLWDVLDVRRAERTILWKNYLEGEGKLPEPIYSDNL